MLYLPFNVYLDSKTVSIPIEAVFANSTNAVTSLKKIITFSLFEKIFETKKCRKLSTLSLSVFRLFVDV